MTNSVELRAGGVAVCLLTTGASIRSVHVPGRSGEAEDVVLGHPSTDAYSVDEHGAYFGCIVGRVANRIADASISDPDAPAGAPTHELEANGAPHALHGGTRHWGRQEWRLSQEHATTQSHATFNFTSPQPDAGYPGTVDATVTYELSGPESAPSAADSTAQGEVLAVLRVTMEARATQRTPINMVQHTHWNLAGKEAASQGATVEDHTLQVHSAFYTPVDDALIPTGATEPVDSTALDLRIARALREPLGALPDGLDHNYVLHGTQADLRPLATAPGGMLPEPVRAAAELRHEASGRALRLHTNAPGLQVYSGNFLDGVPGKDGATYSKQQSMCLETQTYPNSAKQPLFPSPWVSPGETYRHVMVYEFVRL